jgi:hypothetical protein
MSRDEQYTREIEMLRIAAIASGLAIGALMLGAQNVSAAMSVPNQTPQADSAVEKAQYRYCRRWYRECRARWGGGWDFRRCMRRHGC